MGNTESYNAEQDDPVPIHMPVLMPMHMPTQMPMQTPMPMQMPMQTPMPMQMPMQTPMPMQMPMQTPMQMPMQMPMQTPMPMQMPMQTPMPMQMSPPYPLDPVMYPQTFPAGAGFIAPYPSPEETALREQEDSNLPAVEKDASNPNQEGEFLAPGFEDNTVRKAFTRKVFILLTIQILITFTAVCVCCFSDTVKNMIKEHGWVRKSSYIVFAAVDTFLATFYKYIHIFPLNLLGLLMVTLSLAYMVGTSASYLDKIEVVIALGSTLVISFSIIIFSAQNLVKYNVFTSILFVLFVDLLIFGFLSIFNFYILKTIIIKDIKNIVYTCVGALLYAMYLLVDCELVIGRKKYKLNPEQYVLAALIIYLDIILILISLLEETPKKFEGAECTRAMLDLESIGSNDADNDSN